MTDLPSGIVTFLMTDVESSTRLWQDHPGHMETVLDAHDALVQDHVERNGGTVILSRGEGDSTFSVFRAPSQAIAAAVGIQRALHAATWPDGITLKDRMAVHSGEAYPVNGNYRGPVPSVCAHTRDLGHGGQVLASLATFHLVAGRLGSGVSLDPLGWHQVAGVAEPQAIYQVVHADLPRHFPPLRGRRPTPNNLPAQLTRFIGREAEVATAQRLMGLTRIVTITGPGGVGKTRLAEEIAQAALTAEHDGVWKIDFAECDPAEPVVCVATTLGVREEPGHDLMRVLAEHLGGDNALLVFDNCDQYAESCGQLAYDLLVRCPQLRIVATSREALRVAGEAVLALQPLALPAEGDADFGAAADSAAVQLFIDRVRLVQPDYQLTPAGCGPVTQLCRRLDGLPLALEIVAGRLGSLGVSELLERLDRHLLLDSAGVVHDRRHRTLAAAIRLSYDLLDDPTRQLLTRLGVFVGGWSEQAAAAMVDGPGSSATTERLDTLAGKSLIVRDRRSNRPARYRMLETIRAFARDRLDESGDLDAVRGRHAAYFTRIAEESETGLRGPEQDKLLVRLDPDQANLFAAASWSAGSGDRRMAARLAAALWYYWSIRGTLGAGVELLADVLRHADDLPPQLLLKTRNAAAAMLYHRHELERAREQYELCLALARELGDDLAIARAWNGLGLVAYGMSDFCHARDCYEASLAIKRQHGDDLGVARCLSNLGLVAHACCAYSEAEGYLAEALAIHRRLGGRVSVAQILQHQGVLKLSRGDLDGAAALIGESADIARAIQDEGSVAEAVRAQAQIAAQRGRFDDAIGMAEEAVEIERGLGDARGLARSLHDLAEIRQHAGDHAAAIAAYEEGLAAARRYPSEWDTSVAMAGLARSHFALGERTLGDRCYAECLGLRRAIGNERLLVELVEDGAVEAERRGAHAEALAALAATDRWRAAHGVVAWPLREAAVSECRAKALAAVTATGTRSTEGVEAMTDVAAAASRIVDVLAATAIGS